MCFSNELPPAGVKGQVWVEVHGRASARLPRTFLPTSLSPFSLLLNALALSFSSWPLQEPREHLSIFTPRLNMVGRKLLIQNMQLYVNVFSFGGGGGGGILFSPRYWNSSKNLCLLFFWHFFVLPHVNRMFNVQVKLITQFSLGCFLSFANTAVSFLLINYPFSTQK